MQHSTTILPSELSEFRDPLTGVRIQRLTAARSHSDHLYFTEDGFFDNSRQLLIAADRGQTWNMFACQLATGTLRQLTDFPAHSHVDVHGALHHGQEFFLCWCNHTLVLVDLHRATSRNIWTVPAGFAPGMCGADADGLHAWVAITQPPTDRSGQAYGSYREHFASKPLSQIFSIDLETGRATLVHADHAWFTHVNPSPKHPGLVLFCHEGPWDLVQRIWALDPSGKIRPIRPNDGLWALGHEFWCQDGQTVGFHARRIGDDSRHLLGFRRVINDSLTLEDSPVIDAEIDTPTQHAHANSPARVVLDSIRSHGDRLLLVDRTPTGFSPTRFLCTHNTSRHTHHSHAHPRFSPDGRSVVFSSDRLGYCDVYIADVPESIESLPLQSAHPPKRFYWM